MTTDALRARALAEQLALAGISPEDLLSLVTTGLSADEPGPTLAQYVARIETQYKESTRATYATHWRLLVECHGERHLGDLDVDDLAEIVAEAGRRARRRRPGCSGRSAEENCVAALRALYRRARKARLVAFDPAGELEKPRRHPSRRRALCAAELEELWDALGVVSRDPELDMLLVRFHLESGARRAGAIGLCLGDLDPLRQTIWLHEKFERSREQPISASLFQALVAHGESRGATGPRDPVFRYATPDPPARAGRPLTHRHYNTLFSQLQGALAWAERMGLCAHVLRHTAGTAIERLAGQAVASAFLGHAEAGRGTTGTYTKASIHEVAAAVARLTGEPHPLAT